MKVALLGATGTIGSAYLHRALTDGHEVRVLVRDGASLRAAPGLTVLVGDARDFDVVAGVVVDCDAVVSAVGPRSNTADAVALLASTATNVIAAMRAHAVARVVFVAGAGLALPGERRALSQRVMSALVRRAAKWVVAAKERELSLYLESAVDWTAIRPPRVVHGPPTGRARLVYDRPRGFRVSSGDVAVSIVAALADPSTIRRAPYVSVSER